MENIEVFENQRATQYDQFVNRWIPNYAYFIQHLPHLLKEDEKKKLLVVGCGTGTEIEAFAKSDVRWKITGVDPSPQMVAQAKEKLKVLHGIRLVEGTIESISSSEKFSAATLLLVLHFLKDDGSKLHLLKEIADRLDPGAALVILDITGDPMQLIRNLNILKGFVSHEVPEEEVAERLLRIENELHYVSEERLTALLIEAGYDQPLRFFQTTIYMGWIVRKSEDR